MWKPIIIIIAVLLNLFGERTSVSYGATPFENFLKCKSNRPGPSCAELVPAVQDAVETIVSPARGCDESILPERDRVRNDLSIECPLERGVVSSGFFEPRKYG